MLRFQDEMYPIAAAYEAAPQFVGSAAVRIAWRQLADDSVIRAERIRNALAVAETTDPEPYPDAAAMFEDIDRGRFVVSTAHSEHPLWTVRENVAFRIVHDCLGHYPSGGGFDWLGELAACGRHFPLLPTRARHALFTECIAQTGYAIARGSFGAQKVALLTPWTNLVA